MLDQYLIHANDQARAELAAMMAEFELANGKVKTLPIRIGDAPTQKFSIHVPGKPKPQVWAPDKHKTVKAAVMRKLEKVAQIRELAALGLDSGEIASSTGMRQKYVTDLAKQANIAIKAHPKLKRKGVTHG